MNLTDVDDKIIRRAVEQGKTIGRGDGADRGDLSPRPRVPAHPARGELSEGDGLHPADDRPRRAADRSRRGVSGGGRLGLLRDRQVSRLRQAVAARHARGEERRARSAGRLHQGERAGLRSLEGGEARGRAVRCGVGLAVGARPPGLASRVLGDGHGPARRDARPARRRDRPHLPASRGRDRPERGRDRKALLPLVVPRRVPADRRRQDGQAGRERAHRRGAAQRRACRRRRCGISSSTRTTARS